MDKSELIVGGVYAAVLKPGGARMRMEYLGMNATGKVDMFILADGIDCSIPASYIERTWAAFKLSRPITNREIREHRKLLAAALPDVSVKTQSQLIQLKLTYAQATQLANKIDGLTKIHKPLTIKKMKSGEIYAASYSSGYSSRSANGHWKMEYLRIEDSAHAIMCRPGTTVEYVVPIEEVACLWTDFAGLKSKVEALAEELEKAVRVEPYVQPSKLLIYFNLNSAQTAHLLDIIDPEETDINSLL